MVKVMLGVEQEWGRAIAQSPILKTTIPASRLKRKGYKFLLDYINNRQASIW